MRPRTIEDYHERLLTVLVHIQRHLEEPLRLEELARIACFSPGAATVEGGRTGEGP